MKSSAAELASSLEKIKLDLQKNNVKFKLQDDSQAKYDREVQGIYSARISTVVHIGSKEEGSVSKKFAEETDANDHWSEERKNEKEDQIYTHEELVNRQKDLQQDDAVNGEKLVEQVVGDKTESVITITEKDTFEKTEEEQPNMMDKPVNSQEQTTALEPNKTQSPDFELQSSGILIVANKGIDVSSFKKPNVGPNENVAPTFKDNASFNQQDDSRVLSPKSGRILNVNAIITEEEKEDGAMSAEISSIEDITREKKETDAGALKEKEVEESISCTVKEEYFSQLDGSHDSEEQNESFMNKEIESLEHPEEHQVEEQKELQQDDSVEDENMTDEDVSEKTVSIEDITVEVNSVSLPEKSGQDALLESLHNFKAALEDFKVNQRRRNTFTDKFEKSASRQADKQEPWKEGKVPMQDDSQGKQEQKKAPEGHGERAARMSKMPDHNHNDDSSNGGQSVLQATGAKKVPSLDKSKREDPNLEESVKSSPEYGQRLKQKEASLLMRSMMRLFWCCLRY